jgi:hypothetical protein
VQLPRPRRVLDRQQQVQVGAAGHGAGEVQAGPQLLQLLRGRLQPAQVRCLGHLHSNAAAAGAAEARAALMRSSAAQARPPGTEPGKPPPAGSSGGWVLS